MNLQLQNKLCLVTGSTKGIGLAMAQVLHAEGACVIITGQSDASVQQALSLFDKSDLAHGLACDMRDAKSIEELARKVEGFGVPDVLIHNVGYFEVRPFFDCADEHWQSMFDLNVMSGVRLSRWLMPAMLARGDGRVLFVASEQSVKPNPEMAHYAMSKTAQVSIARSLAEMTKGTAVTVNSMLVAPTWTPGVETFLLPLAQQAGISLDQMQREYFVGDGASSLLQRFAQPDEIASFATFLSSPLSSAINGAALRVDGGIVRSLF
jgi:NAD(P)-dependent dehydrogenase (short-subunit alcohol dehydrogenase family)